MLASRSRREPYVLCYRPPGPGFSRATTHACLRDSNGARSRMWSGSGHPATPRTRRPWDAGQAEAKPDRPGRITLAVVTMRQLLEAGVHFGHQTRRWNPKMKRYIYGERNGIYIIDLQKTMESIESTFSFLRDTVAKGGTVLFVGTKKQAQEAIKSQAERVTMPFVNYRWLGGMLTNFTTIYRRLQRLKELEAMETTGGMDVLPKKEVLRLRHEREKLERNLGGIRDMTRPPAAVWVVDTRKEHIAVTEARKLGIPVVAILDTNCDPDEVDYPIPGNDDAIRAGSLLTRIVADAVSEGLREGTPAAPAPARQATAARATAKEPAAAATRQAPAATEDEAAKGSAKEPADATAREPAAARTPRSPAKESPAKKASAKEAPSGAASKTAAAKGGSGKEAPSGAASKGAAAKEAPAKEAATTEASGKEAPVKGASGAKDGSAKKATPPPAADAPESANGAGAGAEAKAASSEAKQSKS